MSATKEEVLSTMTTLCAPLGDISGKLMFGGLGVFCNDTMFALIRRDGALFLKVDDTNHPMFAKAGLEKFGRMPYYAAPEIALKDWRSMKPWAEGAWSAAQRGAKPKKK